MAVRRAANSDTRAPALAAALALPVFAGVLAGAVEFGRIQHHRGVVERSVAAAARHLAGVAVVGQPPADPCGDHGGAGREARNLAMYGNVAGTGAPLLSYWRDIADGSICIQGPMTMAVPAGTGSRTVRVLRLTAAVPYRAFGWAPPLNPPPMTLTASHQVPLVAARER